MVGHSPGAVTSPESLQALHRLSCGDCPTRLLPQSGQSPTAAKILQARPSAPQPLRPGRGGARPY